MSLLLSSGVRSTIPDSVVSRPSDNNSSGGQNDEFGVVFETTEEWPGEIRGEISSNTANATLASVKKQSDGTVIGDTDISGLSAGDVYSISLSSPLQANTEYRMVVNGTSYTIGFYGTTSYPYTSSDGVLSLVAGWDLSRRNDFAYGIVRLGNL